MTQAARKIRLVLELRRAGVTDTRVLSAIERVPRELFVPEPFQDQAYENTALPIACSQTISQPLIVGLMTQLLEPGKRLRVLEIGTGSGYQTAVLCQLFRRVYTIERHRDLLRNAEAMLARLKCHNVTTLCGDGTRGWPEQAPFPRILVTAAAPEMPARLADQLDDGGIMIVPVGSSLTDQWIYKVTRVDGGFREERMSQVRFVPLVAGAVPEAS
ncbi:MAG: protein-L-isoaspartate(D-aspartate) O-methyltransferase [Alphaproteobacteria bacterium]|nr:protein-L-isoaspartate(D-aspartate) O-methyltransferase [Alphaproteobacteria bacterium]